MFIPHCTVIACFGFALTQSLAGCSHAETQLEPKDESHVQAKRLKGCNAQGYSEQIVEPAVVDYSLKMNFTLTHSAVLPIMTF